MLFSGAITAISSLFRESLGASHVKDITLDDGRKLLFQETGEFSLILITPKSSKYLSESITRFGQKIKGVIGMDEIVADSEKVEQKSTPILLQAFGLPT